MSGNRIMRPHLGKVKSAWSDAAPESLFASRFAMPKYLRNKALASSGFVFSNPEIVALPMIVREQSHRDPTSSIEAFAPKNCKVLYKNRDIQGCSPLTRRPILL